MHLFNGTATDTIVELFFDGQPVGSPRMPAKRLRIKNTDGANDMQISMDQGLTWHDILSGDEKVWEAPGNSVISNSRQSFMHKRKAGANATFEGDCVFDRNRVR